MRRTRDERAADPAVYPALDFFSPGLIYEQPFPVPAAAPPQELVFVDAPPSGKKFLEFIGAANEWNVLWESAHLRQQVLKQMNRPRRSTPKWLQKYGDRNIQIVPNVDHDPSQAFAPLYAMLPLSILRHVGLPPHVRATWPMFGGNHGYGDMPADAYDRFSRALSLYLWPRLSGRKTYHAYSEDDPIRVLAHSPTYWLPHALSVCMSRAKDFEPDEGEWTDEIRSRIAEVNAHPLNQRVRVAYQANRHCGALWEGEQEASDVVDEMVEHADRDGRLRAIIEAVRSNRIEDDFTGCWTREREDFERAFYHKRAKTKVAFVELPELEPIHSAFTQLVPSAETAALDALMFNEFLTLLDPKSRSIVVLMRRGATTAAEISRELGYANHSPVSKRLRKIREAARKVFLDDQSV